MSWVFEVLSVASDAVLLIFLANLAVNARVVRRLAPHPAPGARSERPLVSVLVPARNEEKRIAPCLQSLIAQDYPNLETIVLDDQSEDGTTDVALAHGFSPQRDTETHRRLLFGAPLPPGWTGKAWACQQLAEAARGQFLLFTDADTIHHPASVSSALAYADETRADLLTLWPFQITRGWSERMVVPLMFVVAGGALPHWLLALCQRYPALAALLGPERLRNLSAASGQFLLFRRESYFALGGHRAVASHLVEDVALGREVAKRTAEGYRLVTGNGVFLVKCRMYHSLPQMWEGFTKNLHPLLEGKDRLFLGSILMQALLFIWPFVVCWRWQSPALFIQFGLILCIRTLVAWRYRSSFWSVLLHPFGYTLALLVAANSYRCAAGKGVTWKGRRYQLTAETAGERR
ncbi:MAG: glycosyltransferase [Verrucomicrobia bacterium]|nr:glycosyltransferase [Verrucomicrobiota bacterium]